LTDAWVFTSASPASSLKCAYIRVRRVSVADSPLPITRR